MRKNNPVPVEVNTRWPLIIPAAELYGYTDATFIFYRLYGSVMGNQLGCGHHGFKTSVPRRVTEQIVAHQKPREQMVSRKLHHRQQTEQQLQQNRCAVTVAQKCVFSGANEVNVICPVS